MWKQFFKDLALWTAKKLLDIASEKAKPKPKPDPPRAIIRDRKPYGKFIN